MVEGKKKEKKKREKGSGKDGGTFPFDVNDVEGEVELVELGNVTE